jgi:hypothetical protein
MQKFYPASLPNNSFESAKKEYQKIDPYYQLGKGIKTYLRQNWEKLRVQIFKFFDFKRLHITF